MVVVDPIMICYMYYYKRCHDHAQRNMFDLLHHERVHPPGNHRQNDRHRRE